jgi:hypothetical protein
LVAIYNGSSETFYYPPPSGSDAVINNPSSLFLTVNLDDNYTSSFALDGLTLETDAGILNFNQADASNNMAANYEYVGGDSLYGYVNYNQSAAENLVEDNLAIGYSTPADNSGGTANYNLTGTGLLVVEGEEDVGDGSRGNFTQAGTSSNYSSTLKVGNGSAGSYTLTSGLIFNYQEDIGQTQSAIAGQIDGNNFYSFFQGTGSFTQNGGTNQTSTLNVGAGGTGSYTMNGGSLSAAEEDIGGYGSGPLVVAGTGVFSQTAGTNTVTTLYVADENAIGTYTMSGGALSAQQEIIAANGSGVFSQSGGTNTTATLTVGVGTTGSYTLSNTGQLSATEEDIGGTNFPNSGVNSISGGTGVFIQTGGTNTFTTLTVGDKTGGIYTLKGGTLNGEYENVGYNGGTGSLTQSGGAHTVSLLEVGNGGHGSYSLSGGTLTSSLEILGDDGGTGSFSQSGGTNSATVLDIGTEGVTDTYTLSSGTLSSTSRESIGFNGGGGVFIQKGGTNQLVGTGAALYVVGTDGTSGSYQLQNGTLSASQEFIGTSGVSGTFTQTGGSNTATSLTIAAGSTYVISSINGAARLSVTGDVNANVAGQTHNSGKLSITGTGGTAVSLANYTSVGGTLQVDPAMVDFDSVSLDGNSVITGSAGDIFVISGDFTDNSTSALDDLSTVALDFQGSGMHTLTWDSTGGIGEIELGSGAELTLNLTTDLDVNTLFLTTDQLASIQVTGGGSLIYDSDNSANYYLSDASYPTSEGGSLQPSDDLIGTPEPSTWALLLGGGAVLFWWRRRAAKSS